MVRIGGCQSRVMSLLSTAGLTPALGYGSADHLSRRAGKPAQTVMEALDVRGLARHGSFSVAFPNPARRGTSCRSCIGDRERVTILGAEPSDRRHCGSCRESPGNIPNATGETREPRECRRRLVGA